VPTIYLGDGYEVVDLLDTEGSINDDPRTRQAPAKTLEPPATPHAHVHLDEM
jgi:hypothetical protein